MFQFVAMLALGILGFGLWCLSVKLRSRGKPLSICYAVWFGGWAAIFGAISAGSWVH